MDDIHVKIQGMLAHLVARIRATGKAFCMGCMKETPIADVASLGVYIPKDPAITGNTRVVAYPVCLTCMATSPEKLQATVEANIICGGMMIDPRNFSDPKTYDDIGNK
jgi:hypothetical protein